ncbi:MAG: transposase [Deltaproteobacteria bacterium]|nr:transposase [Deltaproteobacteria bacterium]
MAYPCFRRDKPLIKSGTSLDFIARVTSHIPDKGQVMVRYYGLCKALHKPYYAEFKIMLS